ncbi:MAG: ArsR/SmtB family transcription factor, partial [Marinicellaceae bacterium]
MNPVNFYKCLADETRLLSLLLIDKEGELCVCELTDALDVSQPKISRHLAQLRTCGIVTSRKQDQWVYYSINPELDEWAKNIISQTKKSNQSFFKCCLSRLQKSTNRPKCC